MSMSDAHVLITGGAGFVGSHLANALVEGGARVRIFDALSEQVHGAGRRFPAHLNTEVDAVPGDIRNAEALTSALQGITHVYHFAAAVGVGQSMYEIDHYVDVNTRGTAVLLQALLQHPVQRLIVASSMSIYGEGAYRRGKELREPALRSREQLTRGQWDLSEDGDPLQPLATPETKHAAPASVYALSKLDQEQLCLLFGNAYNIPTVALRFFNIYGPQQALSNPYTGVLAIFAARCLNNNPPLIFEDGMQRRDFVSVRDIIHACQLALTTPNTGEVFNIGSGQPRSVLEVANAVIEVLGARVEPVITGKFRSGDIRHCFANIERAQRLLDYRPRVRFEDGLSELAEWLAGSQVPDNFLHAAAELDRRGLTL